MESLVKPLLERVSSYKLTKILGLRQSWSCFNEAVFELNLCASNWLINDYVEDIGVFGTLVAFEMWNASQATTAVDLIILFDFSLHDGLH